MKKLSGYCRSFLYSLWRKRDYFSKRGMLNEDGSFYYDDKRLAEELGCMEKTIMRSKRFSKDNGYIDYKSGTSRGNATKYWILRKPDKKSSFVDITKPNNLSTKLDNLSLKVPQNVIPNKVTNIINKEALTQDDSLKTVYKDGIKTLAKIQGVDWVRNLLIRQGIEEAEVTKLLE